MNKNILLTLILILLVPKIAGADIIDGLQTYWKFDGSGVDSAGNADVALQGAAGYSPGLFGQALSLGGSTSQYAIGTSNDTSLDLGAEDFTIQVWANFASLAGEQTLFEKFDGGAGPGYTITKLNTHRIQFFGPDAIDIETSSGVSGPAIWNQVLVRRSGTQADVFINGTNVGSQSVAAAAAVTNSLNPVRIGERDGGQNFPVNGLLDEIAFWKRAVTNAEVTALYGGGTGMQIAAVPEPSCCLLLASLATGALFRRNHRARGKTGHQAI